MPKVRIAAMSGSMILALLGAGLFAWTWFPPPMNSETHHLAVADLMAERLDLTLASPAWLRSRIAENYVLRLARSGESAGGERRPVWVELHAAGSVVRPGNEQGGAIGPGEHLEYRWTVAAWAGENAMVEISLRLPEDRTEAGRAVWAETADLEVRDYLGMDAVAARAAGALGAILGALILAITGRFPDPPAARKT
ncbi:MAG: hypothetical protein ACRDG5_12110 [Anaerolineales bacterium]